MRAIAEGMRCIRPPSGTRKKLDDDDVRKPIRPNTPIAQRANGYAAVLPQSLYDPMPIHFRALVHNAHLR